MALETSVQGSNPGVNMNPGMQVYSADDFGTGRNACPGLHCYPPSVSVYRVIFLFLLSVNYFSELNNNRLLTNTEY